MVSLNTEGFCGTQREEKKKNRTVQNESNLTIWKERISEINTEILLLPFLSCPPSHVLFLSLPFLTNSLKRHSGTSDSRTVTRINYLWKERECRFILDTFHNIYKHIKKTEILTVHRWKKCNASHHLILLYAFKHNSIVHMKQHSEGLLCPLPKEG